MKTRALWQFPVVALMVASACSLKEAPSRAAPEDATALRQPAYREAPRGELAEGKPAIEDGRKSAPVALTLPPPVSGDDFDQQFGSPRSAPVPPSPPQQKRFNTIQVIRGGEKTVYVPPGPVTVDGKVKMRGGNAFNDPQPNHSEAPRELDPEPGTLLQHYGVNPTIETSAERFSTFAADVDTGSYTLARNYLNQRTLPPEAAVRVEEFVNAFDYGYRPPEHEAFSVQVEAFPSPSRKGYHVLHVGVKGREVSASERKPSNLIFTIDVSGSMQVQDRLPLAKRALELLVAQLDERDRVSVVVYGTTAHVVLPLTSATQKERILEAVNSVDSEGSTNVQAGLELAYDVALKGFRPGATNRIILCSDGVANNGITTADGIFAKVKARASEGITLTTVGFGMGSYNDVLMERLADMGDGHYAYVDRLDEAKRIFVEQLTGTLQVIAKDVKLQLEMNPEAVERYRLIGFENRALAKEDFANDKVDAGEMGAGHAVTAIYEIKFRSRAPSHFATFRARFKEPEGHQSALVERQLPMSVVRDEPGAATGPARLSLVAAGFAEKLRGSYWARTLSWEQLESMWAALPSGLKEQPRVQELGALVRAAHRLDARQDRFEKEQPIASMSFDHIPVLR